MERNPKSKELLECKLTQDEFNEASQKLAKETQRKNSLEDSKKSVTSKYGADINACVAEINRIGGIVSSGKEMREIECEMRYNNPSEGIKSLFRVDNGKIVRDYVMNIDEKSDLFINSLGAQETDDARVFVFATRIGVPLEDREDEDFEPSGWDNVGVPMTAKNMVSQCPGDKSMRDNTYRIVSGAGDHEVEYLLQKKVKAGVEEKTEDKEKDEF